MEDFKAILLEGVFSLVDDDKVNWGEDTFSVDPDDILVNTQKGKESLTDPLDPQIGQHVTLAMHHLPPQMPPDTTKWGAGSCLLEPMGWCPFGHHKNPQSFFSLSVEGHLRRDGLRWYIDKFDGTQEEIPFHFLVGHHARVACATMLDVEKMHESLEQLRNNLGASMGQSLADLPSDVTGVDVGELKDLLGRLEKIVGDE